MVLKFVRIAVYSTAAVMLGTALLVRFCPGAVILAAPGVTIRSPYCSRWQAFRDAPVKLGREVAAARIQMQCRMLKKDGDLELWSTPHGEFWAPGGRDMALGDMLAQEESDIYRFREMVLPGDVVIDCGAWIGTTVRQALKRGARRVVAVEPTPETVECLRRTFAREIASSRVIIYPKGIWDAETTLTFYAGGNKGAGNSFVGYSPASRKLSIPVATVDRLMDELNLERVDYIKADIKGAAKRMLAGATATIRRYHPRIVIATEDIDDRPEVLSAYVQRRFNGYRAECGPCLTDRREVYTDVLFFR